MKQFIIVASLLAAGALFVTGCASDMSSDAAAQSNAVPGEATPAPQAPASARAGWAW